MTTVDIVMFIIVFLSVVVSIIRGFVKEALSVVIWILAVVVAVKYYGNLDAKLINTIQSPSVRLVSAFVVLFIATLFLGALLNRFIGVIIKSTGLGGTDKLLGAFFGIVRGVLIVVALVVLAENTMPQEEWWKESMFMQHIQVLTAWLKDALHSSTLSIKSVLSYDIGSSFR